MDPIESLKLEGWCLSEEGWSKVTKGGTLSEKSAVESRALNSDLRELGGHAFPADTSRGKVEKLCGTFVCQIQKIRNVSAPKANEEPKHYPSLLKIVLTDGTQVCQAIENSNISAISLNTPPGTKLKLHGEMDIVNCYILLDNSNVECLGGNVSHLVDKWQLNRSLAKHTRGRYGVEGGPPPWIPFGKKIPGLNINEKDFKSLGDQEKESKENDEFELSRRDAIAEAGKGFSRKVFGGGTKPLMDKYVQMIVEEGFTVHQAEGALKQSHNDLKKALRNLQRKTGRMEEKGGGRQDKEGGGGRRGGKGKGSGEDDVPHYKPSGSISLFDYLEDKLPPQPVVEREEHASGGYHGRSGHSYRGEGRGGGRGGGDRSGSTRNHYQNNTGPPSSLHHKNNRYGGGRSQPPRFQQQSGGGGPGGGGSGPMGGQQRSGQGYRNGPQFYDSQPSHRSDIFNDRNGTASSGESRNQSKPSGMPDIPEFPFKDSSTFIPPLMSANTLGLLQDYGQYPRSDKWRWKVGDMCMAKYWEDNRYYNARITGLSAKTCVVRFMEYGNFEEVLQDDCLPVSLEVNHLPRDESQNEDNNFPSAPGGNERGGRRDNRQRGNPRYQDVYVPPAGRSRK